MHLHMCTAIELKGSLSCCTCTVNNSFNAYFCVQVVMQETGHTVGTVVNLYDGTGAHFTLKRVSVLHVQRNTIS